MDFLNEIHHKVLEERKNNNRLNMERDKLLGIYKELGGERPICGFCDEECSSIFKIGCCGAFIHKKCPNGALGILYWIKSTSLCPFCNKEIPKEDLNKIRECESRVQLMNKLHNKNIQAIFEIYHNMICENKELRLEIEFLDSFIKARELSKKNTFIDCTANWITGSNNNPICDHVSPKVGGHAKEESIPKISKPTISAGCAPDFIGKIKSLEKSILDKNKGHRICPNTLIEFIYSVLTQDIELLRDLTRFNKKAEEFLLLIITIAINWENEREEIDTICTKGNISEDDIQRILDDEIERILDDEDEDYAIIIATIKIAIAVQLLKPVDESMKKEYLEKQCVLMSKMRYFKLVLYIVSLL